VVKVTDGDTITILTADNEQERIRLYGIDAPESKGNQPYWKASRDQLATLVAGKQVTVTWDKRDRNGRIIGWVMVDDGIWVNKVMVLTGYAWWFERYAPDSDQLKDAQADAKRGLWSEANAVAPWNWRKGVNKIQSTNLITHLLP
jgi:endonuclease YncB( thermonuclease family)